MSSFLDQTWEQLTDGLELVGTPLEYAGEETWAFISQTVPAWLAGGGTPNASGSVPISDVHRRNMMLAQMAHLACSVDLGTWVHQVQGLYDQIIEASQLLGSTGGELVLAAAVPVLTAIPQPITAEDYEAFRTLGGCGKQTITINPQGETSVPVKVGVGVTLVGLAYALYRYLR